MYCPANQSDWRKWLKKNHSSSQSVWLVFFKASSSTPNLSWSEAVDQALCFGWIDSTKKTLDDERYIQLFSKRKAQSTWSKINKEKVEKLTSLGLIEKAGYDSIEVAKANGQWSFLDDVHNLIIPEDLEKELKINSNSFDFYLGLSDSKQKLILHWVVLAKRPETRAKRIQEVVSAASKGLLPSQLS